MTARDPRQRLPSVDRLLQHASTGPMLRNWGRRSVTHGIRSVLERARAVFDGSGPVPTDEALLGDLHQWLQAHGRRGPRRVLNLTGTVIHTNLGRAPLPTDILEALAPALGATDLEFDLDSGSRGDRDHHVEGLLCELTGAEAATVVNNNAAAVLLVLNTFARGKEVPVSRGELVEIGGAFRLPDIMERAGTRLVEVGTTNRTHPRDYAGAMGPDTGMVMKVHPSNYAIAGFHAEVDIATLAELARSHGVPLAWDLGSGSLVDLARLGLSREPMPGDALRAGADIVTFSGDKLLGGPQCGLIVGTRAAIDAIRANPLKRALRVDKLILAALASILRRYGALDQARAELPVLQLLTRPQEAIRAQAQHLQPLLSAALGHDWQVQVCDLHSQIGSGALPVDALPSAGLAIRAASGAGKAVEALARQGRAAEVPVIGRIQQNALLLDLRCLTAGDEHLLIESLQPAGSHAP